MNALYALGAIVALSLVVLEVELVVLIVVAVRAHQRMREIEAHIDKCPWCHASTSPASVDVSPP